jgi:hypothetical protein
VHLLHGHLTGDENSMTAQPDGLHPRCRDLQDGRPGRAARSGRADTAYSMISTTRRVLGSTITLRSFTTP